MNLPMMRRAAENSEYSSGGRQRSPKRGRESARVEPITEKNEFNLSHVLIHEVINVVERDTNLRDFSTEIEALVEHQLRVFDQELHGASIHRPYFAEVNAQLWQQPGSRRELSLEDSRYKSKRGMHVISRKAEETAQSPAHAARYALDTRQIVNGIYPKITSILANPNSPARYASESEHTWIAQHANQPIQQPILIGEKQVYLMPKNPIYTGELAFVNFCQVVYLPTEEELALSPAQMQERIAQGTYQGNLSVMIEPVWADLSLADLTLFRDSLSAQSLDEKPDDVQQIASEAELMSLLYQVPEWVGLGMGEEFVFQAFKTIFTADHHAVEQIRERQQFVRQSVSGDEANIKAGAKFLSHVLMLEMQHMAKLSWRKQQQFAEELPKRLHLAFGLVFSPLVQKETFLPEDSLRAYLNTFDVPVTELEESIVFSQQIRQVLNDDRWLTKSRTITLSKKEQEKIVQGLSHMPNYIFSRVIMDSACNAMSFGGYQQMEARLNTLSTVQASGYINGMTASSMSEVAKYVDDTTGWKMGYCKGDQCKSKGKHQMVGPCDICLGCHLRYEREQLLLQGASSGKSAVETDRQAFNRALRTTQNTWQSRIGVSDFFVSFLRPGIADSPARPHHSRSARSANR